jgi:hypothetical protein
MPCVSRFYGISIYLYFQNHAPPHFHAVYGGSEAALEIESSHVLRGSLPGRAKALVRAWAEQHRAELRDNWERARRGEPLADIAPLV